MQNIDLICVGKLNAAYCAQGVAEYQKRLSAFCRFRILELPEEKIQEKSASPALIEKALKLAPDDPYITDSMGWVLFRQGKLEKAEQYLRQAYAIRSDNEIAVHLAEVLWVKGERQEAKSLLWQVRKKDPESKLLRETMSRLGIRF